MEIMVSVLCMAYNHEKYIRQCLDGFIMQKTTFPFEVLINDDASTDQTAIIIKEYEEKYPELIKPIYQTENQYSQGVGIRDRILYPRIRGKYIAVCEGDDYWVDETKLQQQYDILEMHKDCLVCTHKVGTVKEDGTFNSASIPREELNLPGGKLLADEFARKLLSCGYIFHTSSVFYRKELLDRYMENIPKFYQIAPAGDYAWLCFAATCGNCYYIARELSHYRVMSKGGWTSTLKQDRKRIKQKYETGIKFLNEYDLYTNYTYHSLIAKAIEKDEMKIYIAMRKYRYILPSINKLPNFRSKLKYTVLGAMDWFIYNIFRKRD